MQQEENIFNENEEHNENNEQERKTISEGEYIVKADDLISRDERASFVKTFIIQAIVIGIAIFIGKLGGDWIIKNVGPFFGYF